MNKHTLVFISMLFYMTCAKAGSITLYAVHHPPFTMSTTGKLYVHKKEDIGGACTEIVKAVMNDSGLDYKIKLRSFKNGYSRVRSGSDSGIYCLYGTEERRELFEFIGPLFSEDWALLSKKDAGITIRSLDEAMKYKITGNSRNPISRYLIDLGFKLRTTEEDRGHAKILELGLADLWAANPASAEYMEADESNLNELETVFVYNKEYVYLMLSKNIAPDKLKKIRSSYTKMKHEGVIETILSNYGI